MATHSIRAHRTLGTLGDCRKRTGGDRIVGHLAWMLAFVALSGGVAKAQSSNEASLAYAAPTQAKSKADDGWQFVLGTYLWTTALNGTATIDGQDIQLDATFIDILKATDSLLAFDVLFVARKGRWGFLVDPLYMKLGAEGQGPLGLTDVHVKTHVVIAETTGFYTFLQKNREGAGQSRISIDALLGLRIWWMQLTANGSNGVFDQKGDHTWVDPLAGLMFRFELARGHVPILVRGDFGGWGVGSKIAWAATGSVGYRWLLRRLDIGIDLAYRALAPNYKSGGFGWDVIMHGPVLAIVFGF